MTPDPSSKIFVLDTSVILYDFNAFRNFQEHDVAIPITVLEELDQFKKGHTVINLQAREFIRQLDRLSQHDDLRDWIPIGGGAGRGRVSVVAENGRLERDATVVFGGRKNDHLILNAALRVAADEPNRRVVLVSKDINLRVKARSLGLVAEDYETVRIADVDHLYEGKSEIEVSPEAVSVIHRDHAIPMTELTDDDVPANHYFIARAGTQSALGRYDPETGNLERIEKAPASGITPRNAEQIFALNAILNPNLPLVTLSGAAGTGKTLLALAGAVQQSRNYRQIYLTRPIVPLGNKDIGYLPGDIQSKVGPYMQPLWDNLRLIKSHYGEGHKEYERIDDMVAKEKLHVVPLAYIRGRSLSDIFFIVDEAQNLTPHEVKTIITRAGEGTKIVFTGDIFQIDTPYLDAHSNGLSYLIDRLRGNRLYAHVTLTKGERSELANLASSLL